MGNTILLFRVDPRLKGENPFFPRDMRDLRFTENSRKGVNDKSMSNKNGSIEKLRLLFKSSFPISGCSDKF